MVDEKLLPIFVWFYLFVFEILKPIITMVVFTIMVIITDIRKECAVFEQNRFQILAACFIRVIWDMGKIKGTFVRACVILCFKKQFLLGIFLESGPLCIYLGIIVCYAVSI